MGQPAFVTILIAEDNDVSRELMAGILRNQGYRTIGAVDGNSAIKVVEEREIDLALIDLNMAPKGGFEFVKYMMTNGIKVPVVVVTADDSSDLLMRANELGVKRVLTKPIDPKRLLETVRRVLRQQGINLTPLAVEEHETRFGPEELMQHALDLADKNAKTKRGGPFGAVVADADGKIVGEGTNGITSRVDPTAHAEVMAIRHAAEKLGRADLSDCTLYCSSEPTMMGQALILSVGIPKVYFGLSHDEIRQIRAREDTVRAELSAKKKTQVHYEQTGHDAALKMFRRWEAQDEKLSD